MGHIVSVRLTNSSLNKATDRMIYEDDLKAKAEKKAKAEAKIAGRKPCRMTDEQILECRALHEYDRWKYQALADKYGVSKGYITSIVNYLIRSKLLLPKHKP